MKRLFLFAIIILSFVVLNASALFADETESSEPPEISAKLQQLVEVQQQILKELGDIKSELGVLKVRVSQNQ